MEFCVKAGRAANLVILEENIFLGPSKERFFFLFLLFLFLLLLFDDKYIKLLKLKG